MFLRQPGERGHDITCTDDGTYTAKLTATDSVGASSSDTTTVTVGNVPPTLHTLTASSYVVPIGKSVTATGTYSDPSSADTFTCTFTWDDGGPNTNVNRGAGTTGCSASKTYTAQGVYTITLTVTDDDSGVSNTLKIMVSVYDPNGGGFVTGGGWINSPANSYAGRPDGYRKGQLRLQREVQEGREPSPRARPSSSCTSRASTSTARRTRCSSSAATRRSSAAPAR